MSRNTKTRRARRHELKPLESKFSEEALRGGVDSRSIADTQLDLALAPVPQPVSVWRVVIQRPRRGPAECADRLNEDRIRERHDRRDLCEACTGCACKYR